MRRGWRGALLGVVMVMLLSACSGIPRTSTPQVVQTGLNGAGASQSAVDVGPPANADPRTIVSRFLQESAISTSGARQFLTVDAQRKWQSTPVVIVDVENLKVGNASARGQVSVTSSSEIGRVDASGIYTPTLKSTSPTDQQTETFVLKKTNVGWRIDTVPQGTLIRKVDFQSDYNQHPLYFFDSTETTLIPDIRYTSLHDQQLATWLMTELVAGPRPELSTAVNEIPDQVTPRQITVNFADPLVVEVPGISQIEASARQKLAAQLAFTLGPVPFSGRIMLTDGGRAVQISPFIGSTFSVDDFPAQGPDAVQNATGRFYLANGALVNGSDNKPIAAPLGDAGLGLTSVAVRGVDPAQLSVIAVTSGRVLFGTASTKYYPVAGLPSGPVSRPEWQPKTPNAWVGVGRGAALYRIVGGVAHSVAVTPHPGTASPQGQIVGLRFSPDGTRLATVINGDDGTRSVWIGSVVRSGSTIQIDSFEPITPSRLTVSDVGWRDNSSLLLVARDSQAVDNALWVMQSDGSNLQAISTAGLPDAPQTIASTAGRDPIVSVGGSGCVEGSLWVSSSSNWQPLTGDAKTCGTSPIYSQ